MAFNRDSSLDISLGSGILGKVASSDGTTIWFTDDTELIKRGLTWPRPGRGIQPRISTSALNVWGWRGFRRHNASGSWTFSVSITGTRWLTWQPLKCARCRQGFQPSTNWTAGLVGHPDGTTLWFVNVTTDRLCAGLRGSHSSARDAAKDIDLGTGSGTGRCFPTAPRSGL